MKILVAVKRVVDYNIKIRVKPDNSEVDIGNVKMSMNPFDEIAVEEAIRIKAKGQASEVIALSIGPKQAQETIRTAMALGADRGVLVETDDIIEPLAISKILQKVIVEEAIDLVILGKQSIDGDNNQTGQMLAGLLNWGQGTFASKVEISDGFVDVTREIDGGLETLKLKLPAVITTDLRLNEPRYVKLPDIMKAKKKPLDIKAISDFNIDINNQIEVLEVREPEVRTAGIIVDNAENLVDKLKNEAGVI